MTRRALTAARAGLTSCPSCRQLSRTADDKPGQPACPRCGATLHQRKPNSVSRTWALIVAATIAYVPANILPVTHTTSFGTNQSDTIISGVLYFATSGSWHLALIIFIASIVVPALKLVVLAYLLISVHRRSQQNPDERTHLYRITEVVGRWSMVDVYVITIMVALVQMGVFASVEARPGIIFFGAVVVLTMFAARAFDPRLIWDAMENQQ